MPVVMVAVTGPGYLSPKCLAVPEEGTWPQTAWPGCSVHPTGQLTVWAWQLPGASGATKRAVAWVWCGSTDCSFGGWDLKVVSHLSRSTCPLHQPFRAVLMGGAVHPLSSCFQVLCPTVTESHRTSLGAKGPDCVAGGPLCGFSEIGSTW